MKLEDSIKIEQQYILQDIKEKGYDEAKYQYVNRKYKADWICVGIAFVALVVCILLHFPSWAIQAGSLILVFLMIPTVTMHNYERDFEYFYGKYKDVQKDDSETITKDEEDSV